ncbi:MAG TPA: hypothetical protein DIT07_04325, partial [Sphingobacteriaceae bacterium]|nr:hypothetical protein [Sphingobacteriaceae bacterium]
MFKRILLLTCFSISALLSYSQDVTECPPNMGFEDGTLRNWQAFTGKILADGTYTPFVPGEVAERHTLIKKNTATDPWGTFPLNSP